MSFTVVGRAVIIDGVEAKFSSHLAGFEACMRIRESRWVPLGGETYFTEADVQTFERLRTDHAAHGRSDDQ